MPCGVLEITCQDVTLNAKIQVSLTLLFFYSSDSNHSLRKAAGVTKLAPFDVVGSELYPNQNQLGGKWAEGVPCVGGMQAQGVWILMPYQSWCTFSLQKDIQL